MANVGTAYLQIMPTTKGMGGALSKAIDGEAAAAGQSGGLKLVSALKGVIAAAGIGAFFKQALDAGGSLQQSFGGLETIYGDAAASMKNMAYEAAQAGISANDYAEQAVSFGASLKQAFGGDTVQAAKAADTAIMDMADNAAKMGTDMSMIQSAYQGFAKGNYTMLDNLKLGYGGTKTEMERLLADAQKISGVEYNIDNLGDVYEAIHVIQGELGLTGVAAQEGAETFSGSMSAMKAAAENVMANLALGESIQEPLNALLGNVRVFFLNNMLPMVGNILQGLPQMFVSAVQFAVQAMGDIGNYASDILAFVTDFISNTVTSLVEMTPYLIEGFVNMLASVGQALLDMDWMEYISGMVKNIEGVLSVASAEILGSDSDILTAVMDAITKGLPDVLTKGSEIILKVASGILSKIPDAVRAMGELITKIISFLMTNMPVILSKGVDLVINLAKGVVSSIPNIIKSFGEVLGKIFATISAQLPTFLENGKQLIIKIGEGVRSLFSHLPEILMSIGEAAWEALKNIDWWELGKTVLELIGTALSALGSLVWDGLKAIGTTAWDKFKEVDWLQLGKDVINFIVDGIADIGANIKDKLLEMANYAWQWFTSFDWWGMGKNIIDGIVEGLNWAGDSIKDTLLGWADSAWSAVKHFFGIESPSKLMRDTIGKMIPLGIAAGIEAEGDSISDALNDVATDTVDGIDTNFAFNATTSAIGSGAAPAGGIIMNIYPSEGMDERQLANMIQQRMTLELRKQQAAWGMA